MHVQGFAYSDVPNLASSFGYINASWTLRADLTCRFVCRLLNHMDETATTQCTPRLRAADRDDAAGARSSSFSSGYMQRVVHLLPKQGDREPWRHPQRYDADRALLLDAPFEDGVHAVHRRTWPATPRSTVRRSSRIASPASSAGSAGSSASTASSAEKSNS